MREHSASQAKKLMQKLLIPPSDSTRKRAVSLAQHPQPYSAPPTVFHARKNLSQDGRETGRWDDRCLLHDPVLFRVAVNVTVRRFVYVFRQKVPKLLQNAIKPEILFPFSMHRTFYQVRNKACCTLKKKTKSKSGFRRYRDNRGKHICHSSQTRLGIHPQDPMLKHHRSPCLPTTGAHAYSPKHK